jgi:Flp pilus assembly protein TadG
MLPLICLGMFGVIDFGRALYSYHYVSDAAREATRWASVRGSTCRGYPDACPAQLDDISDHVLSTAPPGIDTKRGSLKAAPAWVASPGIGNACLVPANNPGCAVQVTVTYDFKFIFPFLPTSTYTMTSTSEMIISK